MVVFFLVLILGSCKEKRERILRIWHTETGETTMRVLDQIASDFEKENKGVKVQLQGIGWGELHKQLEASIKAGNPPELSHVQPFEVASLLRSDELDQIDDVIQEIGPDNIFPRVLSVHYINNHYYGIGHAGGVANGIYRKDWLKQKGLPHPETWADLERMLAAFTEDLDNDGIMDRYGIDLPGGDPFFINILFSELTASNGGTLFDEKGMPTLTDQKVIEVLDFFRRISPYVLPGWENHKYLDTFSAIAVEKVGVVYQGYARGIGYIERYAPEGKKDQDHFNIINKPRGPSGKVGYALYDCETWIVLKNSKYPELGREFLKFLYREDNYLKYCLSVPIHLNPIIKDLAESSSYLKNERIVKWKDWYNQTQRYLTENRVIFNLLPSPSDNRVTYLFEFSGENILAKMVTNVISKNISPEDEARSGQEATIRLLKNLGLYGTDKLIF